MDKERIIRLLNLYKYIYQSTDYVDYLQTLSKEEFTKIEAILESHGRGLLKYMDINLYSDSEPLYTFQKIYEYNHLNDILDGDDSDMG